MNIGYSTLILLPDGVKGSSSDVGTITETVAECFQEKNPDRIERIRPNALTGFWGNWFISLYYNTNPHVRLESEEIAKLFGADRKDHGAIVNCARRLELSSAPDPQMDFFNTYLMVLQCIEKNFEGCSLFDARSSEFI